MMTFRRMAGLIGLIAAGWLGSELCARRMVIHFGLRPAWMIACGGILPAVVAGILVACLESRLGGDGVRASLARLGLGLPRWEQMKIGTICLLPIGLAYVVMFRGLRIPSDTVAFLPLVITKFIIAQGIAEEVVFRGFVFNHLRQGRSFLRAATLSAILFSVFHAANFLHGVSLEMLVGGLISMAFSFFVAFPAALLFERGGNVIWGFSLVHIGIDSINWFAKASEPGLGLGIYLAAAIVSSLLVVWLGAQES